jgi:tetratricopeptide (TPR) repeat protein
MKGMGDTKLGKIQEGDAKLKEGIGFTGKTFTRWSPDWVAAALAFEAAVKAYRIAKHSEKLVEANRLLANALCESNSFYNAGNALSAAGDSAVDLNNVEGATAFYEEACQRYREGDSEKMAALVLLKCGKALQKTDPAAAESFFERSIERFFDGEQLLHSRETFDYVVNYYVGKENWPKALETLEKQVDMGIAIDALAISCKAALSQCVIYLVTERYEEAAKKENDLRAGKIESWLQSSERKYFRSAMQGYEIGNQEIFDKGVKDVALCLTGQLTRLLKKVVVPEEGIDLDDMEPEPDGETDEDDPDDIC